jgi:DNA-directed RNA polymerase specialized sigma subunit
MNGDNEEQSLPTLSQDEIESLVIEHKGWSESIARSVARAWSLDWQLDGLDGAALEALLFCARRFDPARGIPFKGYARKRIHEASTEAARHSRGWTRGSGSQQRTERLAREVSVELFSLFPELRSGMLPGLNDDDSGSKGARIAIQQLLIGAAVIATRQSLAETDPDEMLDFKRALVHLNTVEPIHQLLLWKVYWEGISLRGVAAEWDTDELNVIREHKVVLEHVSKQLAKVANVKKPKVRPGLRHVEALLSEEQKRGMFTVFMERG